MRLLATITLLAFLAPLTASDRLSDKEILAQVDEPTAAQLRWILSEDVFWREQPRFRSVPSLAAYNRLVEFGPKAVFKLLARSESDVACMYGVSGLAACDTETLEALLPELASRREMVKYGYQRGMGTTSPASEAVSSAIFDAKFLDVAPIEAAWLAWMKAIVAQGAREADPNILHWFETRLLGLPKLDEGIATSELSEVWNYLHTFRDGDLHREELETGAADSTKPTLQRLSRQALAIHFWGSKSETSLLERVWARNLSKPGDILGLQIAAEHWDWVLARINAGLGCNRSPSECFDCGWQSLEDSDWDWLNESAHTEVREAALRLRKNLIAGFQLSQRPAPDQAGMSIWVKCALRQAETSDKTRARRAWTSILRLLPEQPSAFPFNEYWGAELQHLTPEMTLVAVIPFDRLFDAAKELTESDGQDHVLAAAALLSTLIEADKTREEVLEWKGLKNFAIRLLKMFEKSTGKPNWSARATVLRLCNAIGYDWDDMVEVRRNLEMNWKTSLAHEIVEKTNAVPMTSDVWYMLFDEWETLDDRAGDLCAKVFSGERYFLPDDEVPDDVLASEEPVSPNKLLERMRVALAKLNS
ncbi:MAG: hypothetical protein KDB32_06425 [Planctomycetes bacterium]|nr:hypothetical protein [Planctomycetota bacterium]